MVQALWRIVWQFLKKLNMELPYDPAILFLDIYPPKSENQFSNYSSIIHSNQKVEIVHTSINR